MEAPQLSIRTHALITALLGYLSLLLAYVVRFYLLDGYISYGFSAYHALALFSAVLHYIIYNLYFYPQVNLFRFFGRQVRRTLACESICILITLAILFLLDLQDISRMCVLISGVFSVLMISLKHYVILRAFTALHQSGYCQRKTLLVGSGTTALRYANTVLASPEAGHHLLGYVSSRALPLDVCRLGGYDMLEQALETTAPDEAIIALPAEEYVRIESVISSCEKYGVPLRIIPCYEERISYQVIASNFEDIQMVSIRDIPLNHLYNAFIKRTVDITLSLLMLLVLSPLMILTAVGVYLSTHESVFFTQVRVGKNNRPFKMFKFRSMKHNETEDSAWSTQSDDRRTYFGALIRKLSIDELPQLFNVLLGDMSLIGPRPEIPCFVEQFRDEIPLYMIRHMVKPGMTGLAQINGYRGDTSIKKRIEYDVSYIENWTIWLDIRILLRTLPAIINDERLPLIHRKHRRG